MAKEFPDEGLLLAIQVLVGRTHADRDATLELGLYTNTSGITTSTVLGDLTEPTGGGYARITLVDANWVTSSLPATYAQQTFTVAGTNYNAAPQGYFIASVSAGGTARIVARGDLDEVPPAAPEVGDVIKVTPRIGAQRTA